MSAFSANSSPTARTCLGVVSAARPVPAPLGVSSSTADVPAAAAASVTLTTGLPKLVCTHPIVVLPGAGPSDPAGGAAAAASPSVSRVSSPAASPTPAPALSPAAAMSPSAASSSRRRPLPLQHLAGGVAGGVASTLLLHPLDLIKIRFAVEDGVGRGRPPRYTGVASALTAITSSEGVRGLYRGVTPNLLGAGSSWGLYFML